MKRDHFTLIVILIFFSLLSIESLYADKADNATIDLPSFSFEYEQSILNCTPIEIINKVNHKNIVKYRCVGIDPKSIITKDKMLKTEERGRSETERFRQDLEKKRDESVSYTVEISHADALRPNMASFLAKQQLENRFYGKILRWILPARFYITLRPQMTNKGTDSRLEYRNGGTRGGFYYYHKFLNEIELMTQYEANIRNSDEKAFIDFSDISNSSRRLSYLSLEYHDYTILYGKYWSAYYDVADFTDYFMTFGKQGNGAYNNGGDGSESGTGRVDNMIQIHTKISDIETTMQYQLSHDASENIDTTYRYTTAVSLKYRGFEDISLAVAFAYGDFEEITPTMRDIGIIGDDENCIVGATYDREDYGIALILNYSKNHMNDDRGIYFDAIGAELYMHYDFTKNIRVAGGGNWMIPRDDEYIYDYSIKKGIVSLQYTFGNATFDDLVYIEVALPKGHLANGESRTTTVAIGFRYLIDLH